MTYEEALLILDRASKSGSILERDVMDALLKELGNPHLGMKYIHIAGTNGKGSASAYMSSILTRSGYRTGLYTSPYIQEFTERIQVDGVQIPKDELAEITEELDRASDLLEQKGYRRPTVFELITALGFIWFKREKCDVVVLEVGMGGKLDATNSITEAEAYLLMNIGYDHMAELGDTLELIAGEKAGILKAGGGPAVVYAQTPGVMEVFRAACEEKGKEMIIADGELAKAKEMTIDGTVFDYKQFKDLKIPLLGVYQLRNAAVAIECAVALAARGWNITEASMREGLANAYWPGRVEVLQRDPIVIVDGAHNPQGTAALTETLRAIFPGRKFTFVCGVLADKDYDSSLELIAPLTQKFNAVAPNSYRALSSEALAKEMRERSSASIRSFETIPEALDSVLKEAEKNDIICVFGSLYQVGDVRSYFGRNTF